jgi:hypothetical protein
MNQRDIDLVQKLEDKEAARAVCEVQTTQETGVLLMPVYCSTSRKVTDLRAYRLTLIKAAIVQYLRECSASQWYW